MSLVAIRFTDHPPHFGTRWCRTMLAYRSDVDALRCICEDPSEQPPTGRRPFRRPDRRTNRAPFRPSVVQEPLGLHLAPERLLALGSTRIAPSSQPRSVASITLDRRHVIPPDLRPRPGPTAVRTAGDGQASAPEVPRHGDANDRAWPPGCPGRRTRLGCTRGDQPPLPFSLSRPNLVSRSDSCRCCRMVVHGW